ncbi:MAG: hypothetical protein MK101_11470, partial [Phycisphaerales bacterium]|nr:hypothetical protein [Phycisphaerales bacterium]
ECGYTFVNILLAPAVNLYVVREWFVAQNIWTGLRRADFLISVLICRAVIPDADIETGLITFTAIAVGIRTTIVALSALVMMVKEPRVIPRPWRATRSGVRAIVGTFGWNTSTILATNLHDRAGAFIVNIIFGLWGNAVFGLATRLVSYIRMVTIGMTFGLDAVGARLANREDDGESLKHMVGNATRLHAMMAAPAAIAAAVLAEPLLRLWIGRSLEDPDRYIGMSALLVQIMVVGLAARAVSDGWTFLLYGAGHIRRYAKIIVLGGILDPLFAVALVLLLPRLGESNLAPWNAVAGPSWAVAITFLVFHGILLPMRGAKILGVRRSLFFAPLLGPTLLAGALSPLLFIVPLADTEGWGLLGLALQIALYSAVYALLAGLLLIGREERARIRALLARLPGLAR